MSTVGSPFTSKIDSSSAIFQANEASMQPLLAKLAAAMSESRRDGSANSIARYRKRGKLMPRERLKLLVDEDSPFLEICALAGYEQARYAVGGNVICGIGSISGVLCMITINKFTQKGGTSDEPSLERSARAAQIAEENRLPCVMLVESGGANLTEQFKVFHRGGGSFYGITRRSRQGIPQVSVVFGSSTAGGAYTPGMSDYVIMVRKRAQVFLAGPPLVKMATGEVSSAEELGGAEMHSSVSGVSDYLADDELHALRLCRELLAGMAPRLNRERAPLPRMHLEAPLYTLEPLYSPAELLGVAGADIRRPYDAREVIARIVDGSRWNEFKQRYGTTMVCVFARIHGMDVGILANNSVLLPESALKAAQFIQLCNQRHTPLVFLHNITGFMVGKEYESRGIIKHGSKLINAVSNSDVPALTVILGASYGAGNYAMCGRAYHPRFLFTWPQARVSVMGAEQLSGVLDSVARSAAKRKGIELDEKLAQKKTQMFKEQVEKQSDAFYVSSRCIDDGIIDPRDTRNVLGLCLSVCHNKEIKGSLEWGVHRL